jgi:hydroxymethylglutaryl-CoA reductase
MLEAGEVKPWKAAEIIESLRGTAPSQAATNAVHGEAAGKVILLGEHAAVYGKRVLALPLASGVVATVSAGSTETRLAIPDWNFHYRSGDEDTRGVVQILALILAHFGLETQHFNILVRARIPVAMGLGSSAALAVALIRAFDQLSRSGMRDTEVEQLAFECEKISHGTPSGIDNHIATFGRPVLFARNGRCETVALPAGEVPPLVIAASGSRGVTLEQVAGVRARRERNPALFDALFDEIDRASVAGAEALGAGDYEQLGALMNVCHGLLNALGVSTAELENMIGIARDNGAVGAKLTGAGGGGSIVALCPGRVGAVEQALSAAGYQIVTLENRQAANATTNA